MYYKKYKMINLNKYKSFPKERKLMMLLQVLNKLRNSLHNNDILSVFIRFAFIKIF